MGANGAAVGLCATCRHAVRQPSARGQHFWRCQRADSDPRFLRYPPLPVRECPGYQAGDPGAGGRGNPGTQAESRR